jgi:hypothetical protein
VGFAEFDGFFFDGLLELVIKVFGFVKESLVGD